MNVILLDGMEYPSEGRYDKKENGICEYTIENETKKDSMKYIFYECFSFIYFF